MQAAKYPVHKELAFPVSLSSGQLDFYWLDLLGLNKSIISRRLYWIKARKNQYFKKNNIQRFGVGGIKSPTEELGSRMCFLESRNAKLPGKKSGRGERQALFVLPIFNNS